MNEYIVVFENYFVVIVSTILVLHLIISFYLAYHILDSLLILFKKLGRNISLQYITCNVYVTKTFNFKIENCKLWNKNTTNGPEKNVFYFLESTYELQ